MPAPQSIIELVQRFDANREAYHSGKYNEAQLRIEFLNPFFVALGWDVLNTKGYALDYREVISEDSIAIEGQAKAPDYAFRIGRERKFFVEAKKPSVDIAGDIHPAYQLRRYAWNVHLPLSILTDFEEFAVYDCRNRPNPSDSAATGRTMLYRYTDYLTHWDEIAGIFSREAILKGSFDQYALENKGKKGTTEVDDAFLESIEEWRTLLARNLALRNPQILDEQQLNYAVQMTIDRIIFLRICEDRAIEPENQLAMIAKTPNIYSQLTDLFLRADLRYNSGLFHFKVEKGQTNSADTFTPTLKIDDKVLKEIINSLYYPCPYIFKEIPVEILGQVYEQFLGRVIRLTAGHQAKVEEKPEVRKAGGVYYTPRYIVDYIVQNTVGKLLEGKTPAEAAGLKIVDPACGSGSFLLGAYQYLLNWHEDWYAAHDPEKWARGKDPAIVQGNGGSWKLTTAEKKKILVNNIHGVDIDPQAVEVTKLSLLLKVLEEESGQLSFKFERILPDLGENIQCGNSLIGPDYFEGRLMVDEAERRRVNAFDWQRAFPHVFAKGGFDAVIGNPPYIRIQAMKEWAPTEVEFYKKKYVSASKGNYDIYVVFVEKGLSLLNPEGKLGFILPHKFFTTNYGEPLRKIITDGMHLYKVVHFGDLQIFHGASTYAALLFLSKEKQELFSIDEVKDLIQWRENRGSKSEELPEYVLTSNPWIFNKDEFRAQESITLLRYSERIYQGLATSADSIYIMQVVEEGKDTDRLISVSLGDKEVILEGDVLHPLIKGSEISRYQEVKHKYKLLFPYSLNGENALPISEKEFKYKYPLAYDYLLQNKSKLLKRSKTDSSNWWLYPYPKNLGLYEKPKILSQVLSKRGNFSLDMIGQYYFVGGGNAGGNAIRIHDDSEFEMKYLLGLLNSKITTYHVRKVGSRFRGGYYSFSKLSLSSMPMPNISSHDSGKLKIKATMVALVQRMLDLHKQTPATPFEQERLARDIASTDAEIDRLVYELYDLTPEEIKIVEGGD